MTPNSTGCGVDCTRSRRQNAGATLRLISGDRKLGCAFDPRGASVKAAVATDCAPYPPLSPVRAQTRRQPFAAGRPKSNSRGSRARAKRDG